MRDDIHKLGLPPEAVAYARRSGLSALGPKGVRQFLSVNKKLVNPGNSGVMKPNDVSARTDGSRGPVQMPKLQTKSSRVTDRILGER